MTTDREGVSDCQTWGGETKVPPSSHDVAWTFSSAGLGALGNQSLVNSFCLRRQENPCYIFGEKYQKEMKDLSRKGVHFSLLKNWFPVNFPFPDNTGWIWYFHQINLLFYLQSMRLGEHTNYLVFSFRLLRLSLTIFWPHWLGIHLTSNFMI